MERGGRNGGVGESGFVEETGFSDISLGGFSDVLNAGDSRMSELMNFIRSHGSCDASDPADILRAATPALAALPAPGPVATTQQQPQELVQFCLMAPTSACQPVNQPSITYLNQGHSPLLSLAPL